MKALHDFGLVSCYADYFDLPWAVVEDFRLLAEAMSQRIQREAHDAKHR